MTEIAAMPRQLSAGALTKTLYRAQLRQLITARKTIALLVIQLLPVVAASIYVLAQGVDGLTMFRQIIERVTFPFLIPLTALFFGAPGIVDEMEGRTLTYLTLRPLPRAALYLGKLGAGITMGVGLVLLPMIILFFACLATSSDLSATISSLGRLSLAASVGVITYTSLFALLGATFASSMIASIIYFVIFEVVLAALPMLELLSVRYYMRTLAGFTSGDRLGWLDQMILDQPLVFPWWVGLLVTLLVGGASVLAGAYTFQERQYHV